MAIPRILQAVLLLSLIPATAYAIVETRGPQGQTPLATAKLASLAIQANGKATPIGNGSTPQIDTPAVALPSIPARPPVSTSSPSAQMMANVSITSMIQQSNSAVIVYNITGTSLTIGDKTYKVVNGTGIFNQQSLVVVLHATVTLGDTTGVLILIGQAEHALSTTGSVGVTFTSPQSKLAGKFFLSLKGTLTLS